VALPALLTLLALPTLRRMRPFVSRQAGRYGRVRDDL
jgi:hypothetical protein